MPIDFKTLPDQPQAVAAPTKERPSFKLDFGTLPDQKKPTPEFKAYDATKVRKPNDQEQKMLDDAAERKEIEYMRTSPAKGDLRTDAFFKGLGAPVQTRNVEKAFPITHATGLLVGLITMGHIMRGVAPAVAFSNTLSKLPTAVRLIAGKIAQSSSTFGLKQIIDELSERARGDNTPVAESAKNILKQAAFGGGLGAVGGIPKPIARIPAEAAYGFVTSKMEGSSNLEAGLQAGIFAVFGVFNQADLTDEYKRAAFVGARKAVVDRLAKKVPIEKAEAVADRFFSYIFRSNGAMKRGKNGLEIDWDKLKIKDLDWFNKNIRNGWKISIKAEPKGAKPGAKPPRPESETQAAAKGLLEKIQQEGKAAGVQPEVTPQPPMPEAPQAKPAIDEAALSEIATQGGAVYKGITKGTTLKSGKVLDDLVYFDPPDPTGEGVTTLNLKAKEFTPENVQKKIYDYQEKQKVVSKEKPQEDYDDVVEYHGTTKSKAEAIMKEGFKDFGSGTSITQDKTEAQEYAQQVADDNGDEPAIIEVRKRKGAKARAEAGLDANTFEAKDIKPVKYDVVGGGKNAKGITRQVGEESGQVKAEPPYIPEGVEPPKSEKPKDNKRETYIQEYADMLGQEQAPFHEKFVDAVINKTDDKHIKMLTSAKGQNEVSKKMFTKITGIKLPGTASKNKAVIESWLQGKEAPKYRQFKIRESSGKLTKVVGAEKEVEGLTIFAVKKKGRKFYDAYESQSGMRIADGESEEKALENAEYAIKKAGKEKTEAAIADAVKKYGEIEGQTKADKTEKKSDTITTKKEGEENEISDDRKTKTERQAPQTGEQDLPEESQQSVRGSSVGKPTVSDKPAGSERSSRTSYELKDADEIGKGTAGEKIENNLKAIETVKQIEKEGRLATDEEKKTLVKYTGWGGLSQIFSNKWQAQAKRLKELATHEEFKAARASTINAHYTAPEVVKAMWTMVKNLGFKGGNVLEPAAGVGNFLGFGPKEGVKYHAVELDTLTGSILKNIYQDANVNIKGFEEVDYPKGKFDLVISNVPFASYKPFDAKAKELGIPKGLSLHDYFFAKSLALTKDNGVVAFITSRFTMDKLSNTFRKWIQDRSDLVAAYRLPSTAFKGNAGTEVVTDIIILKKRPEGVAPSGQAWLDVKPAQFGDVTESYNEYFHNNPTHVIGQLNVGKGLYKEQELIVTSTGDIEKKLNELAASLKEMQDFSVSDVSEDETKAHDIEDVPDASNIKNNAYVVQNGRVYQKQGDELVKTEITGNDAQRMIQMIEIRDAYRKALHEQLVNADDTNLKPLLKNLEKKYDAFVRKFKSLNSGKNSLMFADDPDSPLLLSLEKEVKTADGKKDFAKTEAFTQRTIKHHKVPEKASNATDGLRISLAEKGFFDKAFASKLTGQSEAEVVKSLVEKGEIFKDPASDKYVTRDEYLSGNVKEKYAQAEKAGLENNKKELADVIPIDLKFNEISVRIGTPFITPDDYRAFMAHLFEVEPNYQMVVSKTDSGVWSFEYTGYSPNNVKKWGIPDYKANHIIEAIANNRPVKVFDTYRLSDGTTQRVLNEEKTALAEQKAEEIKIEFQNWIWSDEKRRTKYVELYNDKYNNTVPRKFNGEHLVLPGLSDVFKLRPNQKNAIWRIVTNNAVMAAHEVGAGKTLTVIAGAMESKRLGLINKPMIVVPKNTLPQWQREWLRAYPGARILVADEKNFTAKKRKKFLARIVTGNWDGIIIADSSFGRIGVSLETYKNYVEEKIQQLRDEKARLKEAGARISIKDVERSIKSLEARLAEKLKQGNKDDVVAFEELGIDALFVDEADMFKNLSYTTTMQGIKGLGAPAGSQKAEDLLLKIRYLQGKKAHKIVFATGTPISNTMAEVYTMMQYLQPQDLDAYGAKSFDDWAALFGEVKHDLEVDVTGGRYKTVSRFSRFVNIPELMSTIRKVWDIQTASMLEEAGILVKGKNLPMIKGGKPQMIIGSARPELKEYIKTLVKRADELKGKKVEKGQDNMLVILSDGIKASLDMRLIDATLPADPDSKVEKAIDTIADVYKRAKKKKGAQLVFIDKPSPEDKSLAWNPYHYMKEQLIQRGGVNSKEIEFIHDHDTSTKKAALYERVNSGEVRILFGSTDKMGAGTNVQERLVALHHVSVPSKMRPRDITQRNGRIVRSGNTNEEVEIYFYSTKGSLDTFIWQMLESKAKSIDQIMSHKEGMREFSEDIDEYAILKAASSDNPLIKEKVELDKEVKRLQALQKAQMQEKFEAERNVKEIPERIKTAEKSIKEVKADIDKTPAKPEKDSFSATINGKSFTDKDSAHKEMIKLESAIAKRHRKKIGTYQGYELEIDKTSMLDVTKLNVISPSGMIYEKELSASAAGTFQAIDNAIYNDPQRRVTGYEQQIARLEKELSQASEMIKKDIDTAQLKEKSARLAEVNRLLKEAQEADLSKEDATRKALEEETPPVEGPEGQIGLSIKVINQENVEPQSELAPGKPEYTGNKNWDKDWLSPMRALKDWLFTFGKQKRLDPALYDELVKAYHILSTRVENSVIEAKEFFGKKLTSTDRAELTFAREEKSYDIRPELKKESEAFNKIMDKIEEILKEAGVFKMGFIEGKKAALMDEKAELEAAIDSMEKSQEYVTDDNVMARIDRKINARRKKLDDVNKALEQLEDLNFVTHRSVARAVMNKKLAQAGDKERYLANVRRVSYKYRRRTGITPLRILYEEGLLNKHDVDAFNILAMQLSEMRFRITMKGLFDYFKSRDLLLHKNTKDVPAFYRRISPIITGIIASEYNDYYIHPLALDGMQELKDTLTNKGSFLKAIFAAVKTGQFVKPSIIWVYDALQMAYGGALGVKTPYYMAKATKAVYTQNTDYRTANQYGAFQHMYLPVVGGKSETEMIEVAARQTLKDMPQVVKIMELVFDMPLTKDQGLRYLMIPYRALSKFTWAGDKIMRMASYYAFKDMGYSDREAAKLAGNIHGAYSDIAKKPRNLFSYMFFVHSFRILMPKLMLEVLAEPFKLAWQQAVKGNKVKGRDWKRALKAFAALVLIPYLYDKYLTKVKGYKREVPLWKYSKPLDKDFDIVLNVNSIISQPFKWISRLLKYSPDNELPRFLQGLKAWWKWEQHPVYRIIGDIVENRRSLGGGKVYNPNQDQYHIAKDMIEYVIRESFRMVELFSPEDDEHLRNRYNIPQDQQKALFDQHFDMFEKVMQKLFGYAYVTRNEKYWKSYAKGKVAMEYKRRLYRSEGALQTARISEWYKRAIKYIDEH